MSKIKTAFFCNNCGYESTKWLGKCPACREWNTFSEEVLDKGTKKTDAWRDGSSEKKINKSVALNEVATADTKRIPVTDPELNRVLGGGIVPGSLVLVAGEPGIGKSTLFLQNGLLMKDLRVLYISGEESEQQIKMRADRLGIENTTFFLLTETDTAVIFREIRKLQPEIVIVDSIQTLQ
jgi:DNA repair protein RadA/Sms